MRAAAFAIAMLSAVPATAHEMRSGAFTFVHPHAAPTPPDAETAAVYVTIRNSGAADALIAARTEEAGRVEFHQTAMDGHIMRMRPAGRIAIPVHGEVKAAPGGLHLMLMGLKHPLVPETTFALTLVFEKAGEVTIDVYVEEPGGHHGTMH